MKFVLFSCLVSVAIAGSRYVAPSERRLDVVQILRDDRNGPERGYYSFDVETEDGIRRSESGSPLNIENNPTGQQGSVSFTFPNGEEFSLKFVADENGFQPESDWLPVAPAFPHPIPQFVLDQIEKAAREDAEAARSSSNNQFNYYDDK